MPGSPEEHRRTAKGQAIPALAGNPQLHAFACFDARSGAVSGRFG